jgi:hypothetical protein
MINNSKRRVRVVSETHEYELQCLSVFLYYKCLHVINFTDDSTAIMIRDSNYSARGCPYLL